MARQTRPSLTPLLPLERGRGMSWRAMAITVSLVALGASRAAATEPSSPAETGSETRAQAPGDVVQSARDSLRSTTEWLARSVDSWFGDRPFDDGGEVRNGELRLRLYLREGRSPDVDARFKASFRLPNLEQFGAQLFVGRDDPREVVSDQPTGVARQQPLRDETRRKESFFAGLGLSANDRVDARIGLRGGPKPYAQVRYRTVWDLGPSDSIHFRETFFWSQEDRFGSTTALSYEHDFSPTLVGRWLNAATITQRSERFEWSSNLGLYRSFGDQRLLSMEALFRGREGGGVNLEEYGLQASWEQPLRQDWLLGELSLGHFRERENATLPRQGQWALGLAVKIRF